jgi:hypothetical protein
LPLIQAIVSRQLDGGRISGLANGADIPNVHAVACLKLNLLGGGNAAENLPSNDACMSRDGVFRRRISRQELRHDHRTN